MTTQLKIKSRNPLKISRTEKAERAENIQEKRAKRAKLAKSADSPILFLIGSDASS
jgi:hypothetical protein